MVMVMKGEKENFLQSDVEAGETANPRTDATHRDCRSICRSTCLSLFPLTASLFLTPYHCHQTPCSDQHRRS